MRRMKGKGVMDFFRDPKKTLNDARYSVIGSSPYKTVEGVVFGAKDYAPYVRKILADHGNKKIVRLTAGRKPVDSILTDAINAVSLGQFSKQNPYDKLFHLSLNAELENGMVISIEKVENINLMINPKAKPNTEFQEIDNFHSITLNELMEGGKRVLGDNFFKYNASNNNCQNFIMALLQGSNLGTSKDFAFIKQDTESIFKGLEKTLGLSVGITDLGNRFSVARYGGKIRKIKGVVLK